MKKKIIALGLLDCTSDITTYRVSIVWTRFTKSVGSEVGGGLYRTVQVYSNGGELIYETEGNIDIQDTEYGNKVLFDLNGKRHVFYNCSVVTIEK